jgi:hypothetical protein
VLSITSTLSGNVICIVAGTYDQTVVSFKCTQDKILLGFAKQLANPILRAIAFGEDTGNVTASR